MRLDLNIEQAAWYIERDGARFVRAEEREGRYGHQLHYRYEGAAAGGTYGFWIPASLMPELEERRNAVAARLARRTPR